MTIFYRQRIHLKTNKWKKPKKSVNRAYKESERKWCAIRPDGMKVCNNKIPFAINTIERWLNKRGHRVIRQEWNKRGYKVINLIVTPTPKKGVTCQDSQTQS